MTSIEPLHTTDHSDVYSDYDEKSLSTASLRSSIFNYEIENGRSYHAFRAGKYVMPNDDAEQERMDIHYHSLRLTLEEKHFLAPIEKPTCILDIGTGTGIWVIDVADDYPEAKVYGVDLSPIQPTYVPENVEFSVADADEPWDDPERFDLVHTRNMNGFSIKSWPFFYEQAFASMKPGGWVENQEFDLRFTSDDQTMPEDGAVRKWINQWNEGAEKMGLTGRCYPEKMKQQMEEAGFINVSILPYKMPIGPWPKDKRLRQAGLFCLAGILDGVVGLSLRIYTQILGWKVEELDIFLEECRREWRNKKIHSYVPIYVVVGQKPPNHTTT